MFNDNSKRVCHLRYPSFWRIIMYMFFIQNIVL